MSSNWAYSKVCRDEIESSTTAFTSNTAAVTTEFESSMSVTSSFTSNTASVTAKFKSYTTTTSDSTLNTATVTAKFESSVTATSSYTLNATTSPPNSRAQRRPPATLWTPPPSLPNSRLHDSNLLYFASLCHYVDILSHHSKIYKFVLVRFIIIHFMFAIFTN